jgi:hypothetical protein
MPEGFSKRPCGNKARADAYGQFNIAGGGRSVILASERTANTNRLLPMKKRLLCSLACVGAFLSATSPCFGQGKINLDTENAYPFPQITYGPGFGVYTGTPVGNGLPASTIWTIGFYYALGDVTGSVASDPGGVSDPSTLGGGLTFATGAPGDTTAFNQGMSWFSTGYDAVINGYTSGVITVEMVVFSGSDYASSAMRGHSAAFTMTPATTGTAPMVGSYMPTFSVNIVPEPSIFALAGIGSTMFLFFRRKRI